MRQSLRDLRERESQSLCGLIFEGFSLANLLKLAQDDPTLPQEFKIAAKRLLRRWDAACQAYDGATSERRLILSRNTRRGMSQTDSAPGPS